ncbi:methyltransferase domain-containing protein [Xylariomycetidae sp. FL0641]|nr:methyltransferase domain-containing protein [Xylariomycetidae sp. FL0641]
MLPTPDTSHVAYSRVYEPAEDSFLVLDTLSSAGEVSFLQGRFGPGSAAAAAAGPSPSPPPPPAPLVVEIGPGSGVVLGFVHAHASALFGTRAVLTLGVDVSAHACAATGETARRAATDHTSTATPSSSPPPPPPTHGVFLGAAQGDLAGPLRPGAVDVLIFNPPYVPTEALPSLRGLQQEEHNDDDYLLELTYAGGADGMETTDRLLDSLPAVLSPRGCAYVLLCAQNKPEAVKERVRRLGHGDGQRWNVETVGSSGKRAGWEKLQIIRIWRE